MSTNRLLQWERVQCQGDTPSGRVGETLTTSDDQRSVFLIAGMIDEGTNAPAQYLDDFVAFDPQTARWQRRQLVPVRTEDAHRLHPRAFHTTVTHGGKLYVFGGCSESSTHNDLVRIDPATNQHEIVVQEHAAGAPSPRYCHSAVVFEDAMYVFAGKCGARESNDRLADIHRFDFNTCKWSELEQNGDVPPARSAHSAVVCGRRMYIVGGRSPDGGCCNEMFEFAFDTCAWRRVSSGLAPLERARHSAVLHNNVIAVFGGWNGRHKLNDLYLHSLDDSSQAGETEAVNVPERRDCHAAVMWRNTMLVFSGRYRVRTLDDVQAVRLGPRSLVEQCRDWMAAHSIRLDHTSLPDRVSRRLLAWENIHTPTPPTTPSTPLTAGY
jgi:N-acetylneuraminic acid mutarotase